MGNNVTLSCGRIREFCHLPLLELTLLDCKPRESWCVSLSGCELPTTLQKLSLTRVAGVRWDGEDILQKQLQLQHLHIEWIAGKPLTPSSFDAKALQFAERATKLTSFYIEGLDGRTLQQINDVIRRRS